ncbi:MAG: hypothetical protein ACI86P_002658 [Flavobacteriales bacterium]|jgi:hypothetical protein
MLSCDKDNSEEETNVLDPVALTPKLRATIDGVYFEADEALIGGSLSFPNETHQIIVSGSNQFGQGQITIQLYFMDFNFDSFVIDAEFNGDNIVGSNYLLGKVDRVDMEDGEGSSFTTHEAQGIITSINTDSKVMSGSFTFTTLNEDNSESVITEGFFEDIGYN